MHLLYRSKNFWRHHGSSIVWACQWPSPQLLSSPQLSHKDKLWTQGITKSHREQGLDYRDGGGLSWCPSWSNSLSQGCSCGLVHCPRGNATNQIWRVMASSDRISSWTPLKPQHSNPNPNPLANQLWCSRVYSNPCCNCSFEPEIIKIGQSSHKMYCNNIVNFQESTTILNACTKKKESGILVNVPRTFICPGHAIWFGLVLWYMEHCRSFNAKSFSYIFWIWLLYVVFWPLTRSEMPFQVMHRKEVTHSNGSYERKSRGRKLADEMGRSKKFPWYTHRLTHRKRVTCELHDNYFRLMTIKHAISKIEWAIEWALNYYITQSRQKSRQFQLQ